MTKVRRKKQNGRNTSVKIRGGLFAACPLAALCLAACAAGENSAQTGTEEGTVPSISAQGDAAAKGAEEGSLAETSEGLLDASGQTPDQEPSDATPLSVKEMLVVGEEPRDGWVIAFETLNVRRFCYPQATVIGNFAAGQKITVTGPQVYGFYPVAGIDAETGQQIEGYCSADYISLMEYTGDAVQLDVVLYKQTDGRWGDINLGEPTHTMAEIGCTTTCFAMCESYLTGTEILPDQMASQLVYSGEGNLYWPEEYYQYYGTDYLVKIYQKLHQGIPVLIGSRRTSGSQHWVLVTGFDPGDKEIDSASDLTASDFSINDPGSGRTSLDQFFRDLPRYIKIAYYIGQ